jgi:hypothetical protein
MLLVQVHVSINWKTHHVSTSFQANIRMEATWSKPDENHCKMICGWTLIAIKILGVSSPSIGPATVRKVGDFVSFQIQSFFHWFYCRMQNSMHRTSIKYTTTKLTKKTETEFPNLKRYFGLNCAHQKRSSQVTAGIKIWVAAKITQT